MAIAGGNENSKKRNSEDKLSETEDWCFVCKDGGDLILCDHRDCLKVYHADCVEESDDDSLLGSRKQYTCERHTCMECGKASKFYCLCCPTGVCKHCCKGSQLVVVKGQKGLCSSCLDSVIRCEENAEYDEDGEKLDYNDRDTDECLFKEYWDIIKDKEGLTLEDIYSADVRLNKCENYKDVKETGVTISDSEFAESPLKKRRNYKYGKEIGVTISDSEFSESPMKKRRNYKYGKEIGVTISDSEFSESPKEKRKKGSKKEFIGWGSKPLIEFLNSIGKDTSIELSLYDVDSIISEYIQEKGLTHPEKKKKVLCDKGLYSIFRKKVVIKNMIYNMLENHFADNYCNLSDDAAGNENSSKDTPNTDRKSRAKDEGIEVRSCKRPKATSSSDGKSRETDEGVEVRSRRKQKATSNSGGKSRRKDVGVEVQNTCFASIILDNMKQVYLRKSLVEELLKESETFESKIVGSFVKFESQPRDYTQKSPYQLLQVTGIKETSSGDILLQLSCIHTDLPISALSDYSCTEDDCEGLREKVKNGLFKKLTIVEVEEKAKVLHELIMKDWIPREFDRLQNRIDFMNEKGRRRELLELLEKRAKLRQPEEQMRLLRHVPEVIAEEIEIEVNYVSLDSDDELSE